LLQATVELAFDALFVDLQPFEDAVVAAFAHARLCEQLSRARRDERSLSSTALGHVVCDPPRPHHPPHGFALGGGHPTQLPRQLRRPVDKHLLDLTGRPHVVAHRL